jgi:glutathione S-transferase
MATHAQQSGKASSFHPKFIAYEATQSHPPASISSRPSLFMHTLCPYAERAFIALLESDIDRFNLVHIDLSNKPSWYTRTVNPRGLVPSLALGEDKTIKHQVVVESLDIVKYVADNYSNTTTTILNNSDSMKLMTMCNSFINAGLSYCAGNDNRSWGIGSKSTPSQRAAYTIALDTLEKQLSHGQGPYLLPGNDISVADIAIFPFAQRYDLVARAIYGGRDDTDLAFSTTTTTTNCGAWYQAMKERPSCRITMPDEKLFIKALQKEMSLDFFDYSTYNMLQLHPHLDV